MNISLSVVYLKLHNSRYWNGNEIHINSSEQSSRKHCHSNVHLSLYHLSIAHITHTRTHSSDTSIPISFIVLQLPKIELCSLSLQIASARLLLHTWLENRTENNSNQLHVGTIDIYRSAFIWLHCTNEIIRLHLPSHSPSIVFTRPAKSISTNFFLLLCNKRPGPNWRTINFPISVTWTNHSSHKPRKTKIKIISASIKAEN